MIEEIVSGVYSSKFIIRHISTSLIYKNGVGKQCGNRYITNVELHIKHRFHREYVRACFCNGNILSKWHDSDTPNLSVSTT